MFTRTLSIVLTAFVVSTFTAQSIVAQEATKPAESTTDKEAEKKAKDLEKNKEKLEKATKEVKGEAKARMKELLQKGTDEDLTKVLKLKPAECEALKKARTENKVQSLESLLSIEGLGEKTTFDLVKVMADKRFVEEKKDDKKDDKKKRDRKERDKKKDDK